MVFVLFSTIVVADAITFEATLLKFDDLYQIFEQHSKLFEITPPSTGIIGSLRYLEYNGHVLANVEDLYILDNNKLSTPGLPVEKLELFGIYYVKIDNQIKIITCQVNSIKEIGRTIVIDYRGERAFEVNQSRGKVEILVKDWLVMNETIKKPGEVLFEREGVKVEKTAESDGQYRILLSSESSGNYVIKPLGERIDPFEKNVVFLVGYGDGRIIVRSFSKDLSGLDLPSYSESLKIARQIASLMGYKIEECPVYDIPVGVTGMIVLLKDEEDMPILLDTIKRLMEK
ncbi:DUF4941 domain-containing protein [Thermotoga sp. KOL6]|uniref:DUF4941 domain-containing protein n=1 Tax=Thermotoga sp. KOL6 TaxID=126741 RepID=UPI001E637560|nr:DUF4941 domain-containing protein [Thermotoga sp. KOL6]